MEITNELKQELSALEAACDSFLKKYEDPLTKALNQEQISAEENLKIDLMLELITNLSSVQFISSYMQKDITEEGTLTQDENGHFVLNGTPLPSMCDIEIYVHDTELNQDVWKRVFISGENEQVICGIRHLDLSSGIHARIRG